MLYEGLDGYEIYNVTSPHFYFGPTLKAQMGQVSFVVLDNLPNGT